jgi:hypothetical protein
MLRFAAMGATPLRPDDLASIVATDRSETMPPGVECGEVLEVSAFAA